MTAAPTTLFTILFKDEAPVIGSGFRFVFAKRGHKWVYLLSPYTMRACKIRRAVWDGLKAVENTDPDTIARAQEALRAKVQWAQQEPTLLQRQALGEKK